MKRGGKTAIENSRIGKIEKEKMFIKGKTEILRTLEELERLWKWRK